MDISRFRQTYYNGTKILMKCLRHRITGVRIPVWATLYITDRCNQHCTHCGIHTVNRIKDKFDTTGWIRIIDELCDLGTEWFRLLGGEPLLRKDLPVLIEYIVDKKTRIAELITNGIILEKMLPELTKLKFVGISLEGNRENHEMVRGPGSFDKTIRAIEKCVATGKYVRIHMVLNTYNIRPDNIDFMINFCRSNNIVFDFCRLMVNPYYQPTEIPEYYYIPEETARNFYKTMLKRKIEENIPISNSIEALQKLIDWPQSYDHYILKKSEADKDFRKYLPECINGNLSFEMSSDGKMRYCVNRYEEQIDTNGLGSVRKAWEDLGIKDCYQCSHLSVIEQSLMFNFHPAALLNVARLLSK